MSEILCIETSGSQCSVAISQGDKVLAQVQSDQSYDHAAQITVFIAGCLKEAGLHIHDLKAVAVSEGPGSFTGLRIGVSAAKAICFAHHLPLVAVNTLQSLVIGAQEQVTVHDESLFCPMIDARRMEVYTAVYNLQMETIIEPSALILEKHCFTLWNLDNETLNFVGTGAHKLAKVEGYEALHWIDLVPQASYLVPIARRKYLNREYSDPRHFSPFYLKPPNITKPRKVV